MLFKILLPLLFLLSCTDFDYSTYPTCNQIEEGVLHHAWHSGNEILTTITIFKNKAVLQTDMIGFDTISHRVLPYQWIDCNSFILDYEPETRYDVVNLSTRSMRINGVIDNAVHYIINFYK